MISTTSTFPDSIDPLYYHSDVSIGQQEVMDQYNSYIAARNYTAAYALISEYSIFGWFADYFNMIENRISAVQAYLIDTMKADHPDQNLYTEEEPTTFTDQNRTRDLAVDDVWVSTYEEEQEEQEE